MNWNNTSVSKDEYYHLLTMLTIKNDATTLFSLAPHINNPYITLGMLPLLSHFCVSVLDYYNSQNISVNLPKLSSFSLSDVRLKLKLFSESHKKGIAQIAKINYIQDNSFKSKLRFSILSKLNMYYNLGIVSDSEGNIIFNTQLLYYIFQDKKFSHTELHNEDIKAFVHEIFTIITSVHHGLIDCLPDCNPKIKATLFSLKYKDFNTNKNFNFFTNQEYGVEYSLLVLHLLCSLNFVRYVLNKLLSVDNIWLLRAKYITLYYVIKSVKVFASQSTIPAIKALQNSETESLLNGTFRSCMMHYAFINKEMYSIEDKYLDLSKPFWGLAETCFNGISYEDLCKTIDQEINTLADKLESILHINTNTFTSF